MIQEMMYKQDKQQNRQEIPPEQMLLQMIISPWISQAIYVAAKLGIADLLKDGSKSIEELAQCTQTHTRSLYRVLRALSSVGIFSEIENDCFELNPLATYLQTCVSGSLHPLAIVCSEKWHFEPWLNILDTVKTGNTALEDIHGMKLFEYLEKNSEAAQIFDEAMTSTTAVLGGINITSGYDFSSIDKVVEVGGGHGTLIASILKAYPNMQGILFDQPHVVIGAKNLIEAEGLAERTQIIGGDFFESVPSGGEVYILKQIIHDWDDTAAIAILKNCRVQMPKSGKILLIETVIPPRNEASFSKLVDLEMLVITGGCERNEAEYRALFKASGFQLTNIITTDSSLHAIIEGVAV